MATGMLLDGVFASEAIDSSGEVLSIEGCDISDFEEGRGLVNYEHKPSEDKGNNGQEIVGRVVLAKKIFSAKNCETDRQRKFWDEIKVPFIYGVVRLLDAAGNEGAKGLAAQVRDAVANGDKILVRWSIEGTTLSKNGNRLTTSIARRVAATTRPCNRTCDTGLVADPQAPEGFERSPSKGAEDVLEALTEKAEHIHPNYTKLGGSVETECGLLEDCELLKSLIKIKALAALAKATEAGTYAGPMSTGGAVLQREDLGQRAEVHKLWKKRAFSAWHDYDKKNEKFDKSEFRAFLKHQLPEVDDSFIDKFSDLIDDYKVKVGALKKSNDLANVSGDTSFDFGANAPSGTEGLTPPPEEVKEEVEPAGPPVLTRRGTPQPVSGMKRMVFDEKTGTLHTPRGSLKLYIPHRDRHPGAKEAFHNILNDPKVNEVHDRAMEGWSRVHNLLKEGKLPPEVIMHSVLFSQMSPSTPVPVQELMYSHLVDSMKEHNLDPRNPNFSFINQDWMSRQKQLPRHANEYFKQGGDKFTVGKQSFKKDKMGKKFILDEHGNKIPLSSVGDPQPYQNPDQKFQRIAEYGNTHGFLEGLFAKHKTDGRSFSSELMKAKAGENNIKGLKQKTGRYMAGMCGAGNCIVPDSHFVRYLFGLEHEVDGPTIDYVKQSLWRNSPQTLKALEGIDRYYFKHHDAVKHMLESPKWGHMFKDDPEQAIFPSFWKNWCAIIPHERSRGYNTGGFNEGTDHRPFWEAIDPYVLNKSEMPDAYTPMHTAKLHRHWAQQFGETPALMMYYAYIVPHLLKGGAEEDEPSDPIIKSERLLIDLQKALAEGSSHGVAVGGGQKYDILAEHADSYVGKGKEGLVRLPKSKQGTHFDVKVPPVKNEPEPVVDSTVHGIPGLCDTPEQQAMIHGLNTSSHCLDHVGGGGDWVTNPATGKDMFLRGDHADIGWNSAKREAAYYNAARDVFGMHHYMPLTAAFKHPRGGFDVSATEAVPMAEHMNADDAHRVNGAHAHIIKYLGDNGELDKMMLMDLIMGTDRNDHNMMFTFGGEPHMRLVDNHHQDGIAMDNPPRLEPPYMKHYGYIQRVPWQAMPLHPKAREWLAGLDMRKLEASLMKSGMPYKQTDEAVRRLVEVQFHAKKFGSTATKGSTHMAPWGDWEKK